MNPVDIDILVVAPKPDGHLPIPEGGMPDSGQAADGNGVTALDPDQEADLDQAWVPDPDPALEPAGKTGRDPAGEADWPIGMDAGSGLPPDDQAGIIVLEAGQAVEFVPAWEKGRLHKHDIVLGVVRRHVPHLGGVFVHIGSGHDGLLRLAADEPVPSEGSRVVAMVARESRSVSQTGGPANGPSIADKGPLLTRKLAIAARHAVLRPGQWPLRRTILRTLPPEEAEQRFSADLQQLETVHAGLLKAAGSGPAPRVLMAAGDPLLMLAHAYAGRLRSIQVEGIDRYRRVERLLREAAPDLLPRLKLHPTHFTHGLATVHRVGDLTRQVHGRQVRLPCGGTLVFDRTEALHVIDVNSGVCRDKSPAALADRVNREAVREIARQLRLRNLSGMVIVDLIHQKDAGQREAHAASLREAAARDRGTVTVYGFTALGLLELIRKAH